MTFLIARHTPLIHLFTALVSWDRMLLFLHISLQR
jgi:hypothetical protein